MDGDAWAQIQAAQEKMKEREYVRFSVFQVDPAWRRLPRAEREQQKDQWIPSDEDFAYVASLMKPVKEIGKVANWVAKPARGINNESFEFEYVRFD